MRARAIDQPIHIAILGATGYGAGELLRLLVAHPRARVVSLVSRSQAGATVADAHPHLRGFYDLPLADRVDLPALLDGAHAVVFAALPHAASAAAIVALLDEAVRHGAADRLRIIDLSADFRLRDAAAHRRHYPETPLRAELRARFVYGMPELCGHEIDAARLVANPGCLASAAILAAAPLVRLGAAGLAIDAKTGSSGSGRQLKDTTHHATRHADFRAYAALAHRHEPEIQEALVLVNGQAPETSFVAQSMDAARGIFATVHATLPEPMEPAAARAAFEQFYAGCPFIRVVPDSPQLQNVVGSNFCDVSVATRGRQAIAMAALDNLVKGMSGAAIQNMNRMCGLDERTGLWFPALRPV